MHFRKVGTFAGRFLRRCEFYVFCVKSSCLSYRRNGVRFLSYMAMRPGALRLYPTDPDTLMKEDGVTVCSQMLIDNFPEPDKTLTNLTSYLRRFELWVLAFQKVCADEMGAYMPKCLILRSALDDLLALRNAVLDDRFKWGPRLYFFLKSPKDKTDYESLSKRKIRAILTTTQPAAFQDRIVQEVLFMILEPVYEARFSHKSYAFRPGRTAHTALRVTRRNFAGYLWYMKGDLSTILDGLKMDNGGTQQDGVQKVGDDKNRNNQIPEKPSIRHIIAIITERDAAVLERNLAQSEKRVALAERDMAIHMRDAAFAERDKAIEERNQVLQMLESAAASDIDAKQTDTNAKQSDTDDKQQVV